MDIIKIYNELMELISEATGFSRDNISMHHFETDKHSSPDGVVIRPIPANPKTRYLNESQNNINFQVLVRSKNSATALDNIYKIDKKLDGIENLDGLEYVETYTEPRFVERTDTGHYLYTAIYQAKERI